MVLHKILLESQTASSLQVRRLNLIYTVHLIYRFCNDAKCPKIPFGNDENGFSLRSLVVIKEKDKVSKNLVFTQIT